MRSANGSKERGQVKGDAFLPALGSLSRIFREISGVRLRTLQIRLRLLKDKRFPPTF